MSVSSEKVLKYYENNTRRFLRWGKHEGTQNIHQALWAEGVGNQAEAVSYANKLMLDELHELDGSPAKPVEVLDLGCGVGSSIFYLADHFHKAAHFTGLTISPTQVGLAHERKAHSDAENRCDFLTADFLSLPELPVIDFSYSIEAFVHAVDPLQFFGEVGRVMRKGGRLVLLDDFLTLKGGDAQLSKGQLQHIEDFRAGWLAGSLVTVDRAVKLAGKANLALVKDRDYTPYMDIGRRRDKLIEMMVRLFGPVMRRSVYLSSLTGGHAKQECLKAGLMSYRLLVFEKIA